MAGWPRGVERVPDEDWTRQDVEALAKDYDTVEHHGWYANLDPTVDALAEALGDGDLLVDYSGGTGILAERLLDATDADLRVVIVDSSAKFLRLALDKHGEDPRVAFRRLRYLDDEARLERLDEVLDPALVDRGADAVASTNALHLYWDLEDTLAAWRRCLRADGFVHAQSGNVDRPDRPEDRWILDATVQAVDEAAREIVREDDAYARHRKRLADPDAMQAYDELRQRYFHPPRPLAHYEDTFRAAGFEVDHVEHRVVPVDTVEWSQFLQVYHEGVLGWVGGSPRVEDVEPDEDAIEDRKALIDRALSRVVGGADGFEAEWTYLTCRPA